MILLLFCKKSLQQFTFLYHKYVNKEIRGAENIRGPRLLEKIQKYSIISLEAGAEEVGKVREEVERAAEEAVVE